jgi:hypothetical protein
LSSIWMSGYGIAARGNGNLFFSTGNSSPGTYDGVRNIQESVVKVDSQLVNLLGIFTPFTENTLDQTDGDLSSGGVMPLPAQTGPFPYMDVAAGKAGTMYLLNEASLGGFTPGGPDKVLDTKTIGKCWCGPTYFTGSDGVGRVVSSGGGSNVSRGTQITVWKDTDLAHGYIRPGRSDGEFGQQPAGRRNLYKCFVERHTSWNSHHMGDRTTERPEYLCRHSLCLRGDAFEWNAPVAVFLAGWFMAQHRLQRQYRAGRGEWTGVCGEQ